MDVKKEIVSAITIIAETIVKKTCPTIKFGIVKSIDSNKKCTIVINNIDYSVNCYGGGKPSLNEKIPVFVPFNNMAWAFVIDYSGGITTTDASAWRSALELDHIPANFKIQSGSAKTSTSTGTVAVTFSTAFSSVPTVVCSAYGGSTGAVYDARPSNVSSSGFTINCVRNTGNSISLGTGIICEWIAVGV